MRTFVILSLVLAAALCSQRILKQETHNEVKNKATWESYSWDENPFKDITHDQLHSLVGTRLRWDHHNIKLFADKDNHTVSTNLPDSFDSRTQWRDCVLPVRNQQHCGSCWAFSGAEVLSDRFCIATGGKTKVILSPQDMVSCDENDNGCQGGMLENLWRYLETTGIVSDECLPYVSGDGKNVPHCPHGKCANDTVQYVKYRAKAGESKALTCANEIKTELIKNGPVQTGFMVYEDFMHYKSGIYEHVHGDQLGGHAVKIVGWGKENGKEFWIAQNSWDTTWGEGGFFRIAMGQCLFDENAYTGYARTSDFTPNKFLFHQH